MGSVEAQKTNLEAGQPLAEDLGSFRSNDKADHNCPYLPFWGIKHPVMAVCMWCIDVDAAKTPMHINQNKMEAGKVRTDTFEVVR